MGTGNGPHSIWGEVQAGELSKKPEGLDIVRLGGFLFSIEATEMFLLSKRANMRDPFPPITLLVGDALEP